MGYSLPAVVTPVDPKNVDGFWRQLADMLALKVGGSTTGTGVTVRSSTLNEH